jgi:hypothetical protein
VTAPNPFQGTPQQAPAMISDAAAQQFAPSPDLQQAATQYPQAQPQQAPNAFTQPAQAYAATVAQGQHPVQQAYDQAAQFAQQAVNAPAPAPQQQGLPGQPWSPQQHAQAGSNGFGAQQAYAPQVQQPQQQFAQQAPPAPQGFPQATFPPAQQQMPGMQFGAAQAAPQGGGFDPSMFGGPSQGGGTFPKVRDLEHRLCLFRVKRRDAQGTDYNDKTKTITNYIANVAVLDGGPLYSSPAQDDVTGTPTLVSETVPYVVGDMTIGQVGLQSRLKQDYVRGRVVRMPKGETEKGLMQAYPGMEPWQALATWLQQDPARIHQLKSGTFFWGIVPDDSEQAGQLVQQFAQNPISRELML